MIFICTILCLSFLSACRNTVGLELENKSMDNYCTVNEIKSTFKLTAEQPSSKNTLELKDMEKVREKLGSGIVRRVSKTDAYSVYNCENGGKLYVFFDDTTLDYERIICSMFSMGNLTKDNFNEISVNKSKLTDVEQVDPATQITYIDYGDEKFSTHFTSDGILKIHYKNLDNQLIVSSIDLYNKDLVNLILDEDLVL